MANKSKFLLLGSILLIIAIGCAGVSRVRIQTIKDDPGRFNDQRVVIRGQVVETFALPFLGQGLCKVNDGTGGIWVKPRNRVPFKGEKIQVVGKVKVGLTFASRSFGIIVIEEKQEEK